MNTMHVIYRFAPDYKDSIGDFATEADFERYDEIIAEMLPDWANWFGNEILADLDHDADDLNMAEILDAAFEELCAE